MESSVKRKIQGVVVSDKNDKTVVISAQIIKPHKKYRKRISLNKKFMADDPENKYKVGDTVIIEETVPVSRRKKWRVANLIR